MNWLARSTTKLYFLRILILDICGKSTTLLGGGNAPYNMNFENELCPNDTPYIRHPSEENMAASLARRVSGVYLQFDIHTFAFHSHDAVNI